MLENFKNIIDILYDLINWPDVIGDLIVAFIVGIAGLLFTKKYVPQIWFSNKMKELGFEYSSTKPLSQFEFNKMCKDANEIKMFFVSGRHLLNEKEYYIRKALKNGVEVKCLLCNPQSIFLNNIEVMENTQYSANGRPLREIDNKISEEIYEIIDKYKDTELKFRFYSTEYRLPYILCYNKDGSVNAWLTVSLPPYKSDKSFILRGLRRSNHISGEDLQFVDMMETNFDNIWNNYSNSADKILQEKDNVDSKSESNDNKNKWTEYYKIAKENINNASKSNNRGSKILIEVAAQHPLLDGEKPNHEFEKRLDLAIKLYNEKSQNNDVNIYVPGSLHQYKGVQDIISLSAAGKKYLISKGIPEIDILSEEMNLKYKGNDGVYNSSDECYVSCKIFESGNYNELHCVCSSAQMMRKALSYIRFGYIPNMHTVSCENMYHNYIKEVYEHIPVLLNDDNAFQDANSKVAANIRKNRKPE